MPKEKKAPPRNEGRRATSITRARKNHLKRALQSCGKVFAEKLQAYYLKNPNPGTKR